MNEITTDLKRIIRAPDPIGLPMMQTTGMQLSVALDRNEDVVWHWQHLPNGSYVSGYTVIQKPSTP
ncbi:MAG: hypothetical protein QOI07_904 [Verrucomicrobiota bacterium]